MFLYFNLYAKISYIGTLLSRPLFSKYSNTITLIHLLFRTISFIRNLISRLLFLNPPTYVTILFPSYSLFIVLTYVLLHDFIVFLIWLEWSFDIKWIYACIAYRILVRTNKLSLSMIRTQHQVWIIFGHSCPQVWPLTEVNLLQLLLCHTINLLVTMYQYVSLYCHIIVY